MNKFHLKTAILFIFYIIKCQVLIGQNAPSISYENTNSSYCINQAMTPLIPTNNGGLPDTVGNVSNFAGNIQGFSNGLGYLASFNTAYGVAVDVSGNIYVADTYNHKIRKITPTGTVSTLAGTTAGYTDGDISIAEFNYPYGVTVDIWSNVYVADAGNNCIRKISPNGTVTTLAGSPNNGYTDGDGVNAQFSNPYSVATDALGNVYVADRDNHKIRKITPNGVVTTLAGGEAGYADGAGDAAQFNYPFGLCVDINNNVFVADQMNNKIRKITPDGVVTTLAGGEAGYADGIGSNAQFGQATGIAVTADGNLYVADVGNNRIRKIDSNGMVTTIAGNASIGYANGIGANAKFAYPYSVAIDAANNIYVADRDNHKIRKITLNPPYTISPTLPAGMNFDTTIGVLNGIPTTTTPNTTYAIIAYNGAGSDTTTLNFAINSATPTIQYSGVVTNYCINQNIVPLNPTHPCGSPSAVPLVTTWVGSGSSGYADGVAGNVLFSVPRDITINGSGNLYVSDGNRIRKITPDGVVTTLAGSGVWGYADGIGTNAQFSGADGICTDSEDNLYVSDGSSIRKITPDGVVTTLAGSGVWGYADGAAASAKFNSPRDVVTDANGNVYVSDYGNYRIRKITPNGMVSTLAGSGVSAYVDGVGSSAQFFSPGKMVIDVAGNLYVNDSRRIRKITPDGVVTTLAGSTQGYADGTGTNAQFSFLNAIGINPAGNLYVSDDNRIRKITPNGVVSTLAGSGIAGYADGIVANAQFRGPVGIAIDPAGNKYVIESGNCRIRKITQAAYRVSPLLPPGMNLNPTTGIISGNPTQVTPNIIYTITAYNEIGNSSTTLTFSIGLSSVIYNDVASEYCLGESISPINPVYNCGIPNKVQWVSTFASIPQDVYKISRDTMGNVYVAEKYKVLKITTNGVISTLAGNGIPGDINGTGTNAQFNDLGDITVDVLGNVYVTERGSYKIRKITPDGIVSTLAGSNVSGYADGIGGNAKFINPIAITIDAATNNIYVIDNRRIRKITPNGIVSTLAGDGTEGQIDGVGTSARFDYPSYLTTDVAGNVYVAQEAHLDDKCRIRKVTPEGIVSTLIEWVNMNASIIYFSGIVADNSSNIYITQSGVYGAAFVSRILKITPNGTLSTIATNKQGYIEGSLEVAEIDNLGGLTKDNEGNLYFIQFPFMGTGTERISKITFLPAYDINPALPEGISLDPDTGIISGIPNTITPTTTYTIITSNNAGSSSSAIDLATISCCPNPELPDITPIIVGQANTCDEYTYIYSVSPIANSSYTWTVTGGVILSGQGTPQINVRWTTGIQGVVEILQTIP
jgi:sugar lactone lactonase YvrE